MPPELTIQIGFYVVFLLSVTLHEAGHAWAAYRLGDPTAYLGGQVSVDPMPHIQREPFGMVLMPIISLAMIGWPLGFAHVPVDPRWAAQYPKRAAWMSLAGPGANLLLLIVASIGMRIGLETGFFVPFETFEFHSIVEAGGGAASRALAPFLSLMFLMNLLLLAFNLIPVPPLDGSSAIALFVPRDLLARYRAFFDQPMMALVGLGIGWAIFNEFFGPLLLSVVNLLMTGHASYVPG